MLDTEEKLWKKIMILNDRVWEGRASQASVRAWLDNFSGQIADIEVERLHALYWLSQFMYFGSREIRVLLRSLFRDHYLCPMIQEVRDRIGRDASPEELDAAVEAELQVTRFFGVGNPSESGVHLLYYFRQENHLPKSAFMDAVQIFSRKHGSGARALRHPGIKRYVFLDDICGSGDTAKDYSEEIIDDLLTINSDAKVSYLSLFATTKGLDIVRAESRFGNNCGAVYELDETYRCLEEKSRHFGLDGYPEIDQGLACKLMLHYGNLLNPDYASGWKDSQMLMGFHHNTPDNTLASFWWDGSWGAVPWVPIFKRYPKYLGQQ